MKRQIVEIDENRCNGCGQCVLDCAEGAIAIVNGKAKVLGDHLCDGLGACLSGCPQDALRIIEREAVPFDVDAVSLATEAVHARQAQWPVKLRLVQPSAPFVRGAHLLVTADCAPAASRHFHQWAKGKVVLLACPKFEDGEGMIERLAELFVAACAQHVTVLRMEVPCCKKLAAVCREAALRAGGTLVVEEIIVSREGERHTGPVTDQAKGGLRPLVM